MIINELILKKSGRKGRNSAYFTPKIGFLRQKTEVRCT